MSRTGEQAPTKRRENVAMAENQQAAGTLFSTSDDGGEISREALAFAIFCIENLARRLSLPAPEVHRLLTQKSDLLYRYISPCYAPLHTQDKDYIVDDILGVMQRKGVWPS